MMVPAVSTALLALVLASPADVDARLSALAKRITQDAQQGNPIVIEAHVPLCDETQIRCGLGRGIGDDLRRNLYWATAGSLPGWFGRTHSGWRRVARLPGDGVDQLEVIVFRRTIGSSIVYVVAHAWRGQSIDRALNQYVQDAFTTTTRAVRLPDGLRLNAGGAAHVVAYLGHNRWMDRTAPDQFPIPPPAAPAKGTIALACHTAPYIGALFLPAGTPVPLLMTRDFVFPSAAAFEGALLALLHAEPLSQIRTRAASAYANAEGKPFARVQGVFTNPAHARWRPGNLAARWRR